MAQIGVSGVYVDVSTIRKFVGRVRWRWVLPITMVGITSMLLVWSGIQQMAPSPVACGDCGDMRPPAMVVALSLNGPALYFGQLEEIPPVHVFGIEIYDVGALLPIFAFWFLVGLTIDRGSKGETLLKSRWLRSRFSLLGLLSCLVMGWWFTSKIDQWAFDPRIAIHMLGLIGLWTADLSKVVQLPWCLFGIIYFTRTLWRLYRSPTTNRRLTVTN